MKSGAQGNNLSSLFKKKHNLFYPNAKNVNFK